MKSASKLFSYAHQVSSKYSSRFQKFYGAHYFEASSYLSFPDSSRSSSNLWFTLEIDWAATPW